jgi:hypothetical protein
VKEELVAALERGGQVLLQAVRARAPRRTGALVQGLTMRVLPKTLRLRVGFLGKSGQKWPFYGRIQDLGRRGQTVTVHRLSTGQRAAWHSRIRQGKARTSLKPRDIGSVYQMRVRAMAPKHFVTGRMPDARAALRQELRGIFSRALKAISGGAGD